MAATPVGTKAAAAAALAVVVAEVAAIVAAVEAHAAAAVETSGSWGSALACKVDEEALRVHSSEIAVNVCRYCLAAAAPAAGEGLGEPLSLADRRESSESLRSAREIFLSVKEGE